MEDHLKTTPAKVNTRASTSTAASPSTRASTKKGIKNAKITNFFTKVNSPLARNSSNSNNELGLDDSNGDASSSSMKAPSSNELDKRSAVGNKDYVFIVPSSDDDTNVSTKGSQSSKRKRPPSVHSNNSKSSDGFVLTTNTNNELGLARKKRALDLMGTLDSTLKNDNNSSSNLETSSRTPTRSSSRGSTPTIQSVQKITRIQPTRIGSRTKMIDFQSVPSDLNLPREKAHRLIEKLFFFKMPEDFYLFWDFAKTINHRKPCSAFAQAYLEWNLVGPYDVLSGLITDFHGFSRENLMRHCRYYYDPPELQTVVIRRDDQYTHYGYYRDEPQQDKPIVVMNRATTGGHIHEVGDNLFTLLRSELESSIATLSKSSQDMPSFSSSSSSSRSTPTRSMRVQSEKQTQLERAKAKQELTIIRDKLLDFCSNHENLSSESWSRTNARRMKRRARTMSSIGVTVPRDGCDRESTDSIEMTDTKLKALMTQLSELKEGERTKSSLNLELCQMIESAKLACEEQNFSPSLELGLNLFYHGDPSFHDQIESLLTHVYKTLGRQEFADILKSHISDRKKCDKVSLLD